jgi:hypothetical protein
MMSRQIVATWLPGTFAFEVLAGGGQFAANSGVHGVIVVPNGGRQQDLQRTDVGRLGSEDPSGPTQCALGDGQ